MKVDSITFETIGGTTHDDLRIKNMIFQNNTLQFRRVMQITRFDPFTLQITYTSSFSHQT